MCSPMFHSATHIFDYGKADKRTEIETNKETSKKKKKKKP